MNRSWRNIGLRALKNSAWICQSDGVFPLAPPKAIIPPAQRLDHCPTRLPAGKLGNAVFASELIDAMRTSPDAVNILRQEVEGKDAYSDLGRAWLYPNSG